MLRLTCNWSLAAKRDVVLDSQLPQGMSGDKLRDLEQGPSLGEPTAPEPEAGPPYFTKEVTSPDLKLRRIFLKHYANSIGQTQMRNVSWGMITRRKKKHFKKNPRL